MIRPLLVFAATASLLSSVATAQTWAERLGYPANKRVVILYANYMGSAYEFNRPGQELLESGHVQSAGLMVPCPWFEEFAQWCRENPGHDIGVCLTLNSPGSLYRWRPLGGEDASSLMDADGYFWQSEMQVALRADEEQVGREIDRQIRKAKMAGVRPSHLTPFMGTLVTRPELLSLYLDAAERNWIPAVMVDLTPENIQGLRDDGFPVTNELIERVARYPLPKLDQLHFIPEADSYEGKRDKFMQLVRELPAGLTKIIAGPADQTPALERMTPNWQLRVWEKQLLSDPQIHRFLKEEGIVLTNWIEIMQRFESGATTLRSQPVSTPEAQDAPGGKS